MICQVKQAPTKGLLKAGLDWPVKKAGDDDDDDDDDGDDVVDDVVEGESYDNAVIQVVKVALQDAIHHEEPRIRLIPLVHFNHENQGLSWSRWGCWSSSPIL